MKPDVESIDSEAELEQAVAELRCLLLRGSSLSAQGKKRFQQLADTVERYEAAYHPIPDPSHGAMLEHLLDAKGEKPEELAKALGVSVREVKAILSGKRPLTATEADAIARHFHVDVSVFHDEPERPEFDFAIVGKNRPGRMGFTSFAVFEVRTASADQGVRLVQNLLTALPAPYPMERSATARPVQSKLEAACA